MFRTFAADVTCNGILMCLKLFLGKISESVDINHFLQFLKRCFTFVSSVIISRAYQAVFHLTVCDHNPCILQYHRRILIIQCAGIQEDRTVFFAHCTCKLIHNTTVHSVKIVFGILSDQGKILHGKLFYSKHVLQHQPGQDLQRRRRRKSGTIGNISVDQEIHTGIKLNASFFKCPHNPLRVVCPACLI